LADDAVGVQHTVFDVGIEERLIVVEHDLVVEQVHQLIRRQVVQLEVKVVELERVSGRLVLGVVELSEIWVLQCLLYRDAPLR